LEEDLVLQFITALSFSSSLLIVCILFLSFFLGVLGGWWWRSGELVAEEVFYRWEWVDGLVSPMTWSLPLYTFFHFGVEKLMEVGGFPFLSRLSQHMGCSPLFSFLCLFNFFC
jgi:hypothetical protein